MWALKFVVWSLNDSGFKLNARCVTASNVYYLGTYEIYLLGTVAFNVRSLIADRALKGKLTVYSIWLETGSEERVAR